MAFRIQQPQAAPAVVPAPPTIPDMPPQDAVPQAPVDAGSDDDGDEGRGGAKVSQESARYFGPEMRCSSCVHYLEGQDSGECDIVAGPIEAEGICSLYTPDSEQLGADDEDGDEPTEAPTTPPVAASPKVPAGPGV